jgi:hypothetical protein
LKRGLVIEASVEHLFLEKPEVPFRLVNGTWQTAAFGQ